MQAIPAISLSRQHYFGWRSPGLGTAVYFRKKVMEWLSARACASVHLTQQNGEPASGVLLGGRMAGGTLVVEGAEPLRRHENPDEQIRQLRAEGAVVLGTYRVATAEAVQGSQCPGEIPGSGLCLALVVDPAGGPVQAAISLASEGPGSWSKLEPFPFGQSSEPRNRSRVWVWMTRSAAWVSVSMASFALAAAMFWWIANPPVGSAAPPGLELSAEQSGGQWVLRWNPHSPGLADARWGYVVIGDGTEKSRYALTPEQLRAGAVHYAPSRSQVAFTLEIVTQSGGSSRETLIVVHHTPKEEKPKRGPTARRRPEV
jgi:hypothetical protein